MSCLYSSPEVECTKMRVPWERAATPSRAPISVPFQPSPMLPTVALNKNAFPTRRHDCRRTSFNSAQFSCVGLQAQIWLSFALRSRAAQPNQPSRSTRPAFWNLSTGVALATENRCSDPLYAGVLNRCYERNVVAPAGYSKRFLRSNRALGGHFSARNSPENAREVRFRPAVHR